MNTNLVNLIPQFFDSSGNPLSGGTLNTYVASTSTTLATYPTNADAIAGTNANPTSISIGSSGYPMVSGAVVGVFLKPGKQYKFILKDSSGITIYTVDSISNLTDTLLDGNGNEVIKLVGVASAVNEITVTNAATGTSPSIAATGDDTNVGLKIKTKGTGTLELLDGSNNELVKLNTVALAVNEVSITNAVTGSNPQIASTGNDTNIGITLSGKGTGDVNLGQATSVNTAITSGNIKLMSDQPLVDSSGNELIKFAKTASAVNEITVTNAATGNGSMISSTGGDTNIDLILRPKGTGTVKIQDSSGISVFKAPTIQKFTTGSGTYTLPASCLYLKVKMVGGGGGGAGSSSSANNGGNATNGGNSTFGASTANGGTGGLGGTGKPGGVGGSATLGAGHVGTALTGGQGDANTESQGVLTTYQFYGSRGGTNPLGGAGSLSPQNTAGIFAAPNTGGGGGGAGATNGGIAGAAGGAGGYLEFIIASPSATYAYAVGAKGTGGAAGTSGLVGGDGGSGYIEVTEYY